MAADVHTSILDALLCHFLSSIKSRPGVNRLCTFAATVGVVTETNAEKAIEELKAYEVCHFAHNLLLTQFHTLT